MRNTLLLSLGLCAAATGVAQLPAPDSTPLLGARNLALSPDGDRLAFVWQGDVWVAPSAGGRAIPLTTHVELDSNPVWSPDGKWVAFTSARTGNNDIFVVPSEGGQARRLTWFAGGDSPSDWSPDGKSILFSGSRETAENGVFTLDVATGRTTRIFLDMVGVGNPRFSADGKSILYTRLGFPWTRPRYEGSAASQLWRYDIATGKRTLLRNNGFQHLWPRFAVNGTPLAVTVTEKTPSSPWLGKPRVQYTENANKTPNVYAIEAPNRQRRLTNFVGGSGTRHLTVAQNGGLMAYEVEGKLYTQAPNGQPREIKVVASTDDKFTQEERLILERDATDIALSPKADKIAFVVRDEIWMVPVKRGKGPNANDATQLTDWEGVDLDPLWHPNNRDLFFVSDREGALRLYKLNTETNVVTAVSQKNADVSFKRLTPDKKKLSFVIAGPEGGLFTVPVDGGAVELVLKRPNSFGRGGEGLYDWSPDGRYVAYTEPLVRSGYYIWEAGTAISIFDTQTKQTRRVTNLNAQHSNPLWSPDGKFLYLRSNRDGDGIYVLPLKREDRPVAELELTYVKPTAPVKVEVDFDGIERRIRRLSAQVAWGNLRSDATNGDIYFIFAGDVWRVNYAGEAARAVSGGGGIGSFEFSDDGNWLVFVRNGELQTLNLRNPQLPVTGYAFRADWTRDLRRERRAAFHQFWREYNRSFYDGNFHGRDWAKIRDRHEPLLASVGHRSEMANLLNMMVGELEASHTEAGAAPGPADAPRSASGSHPGFTFDYGFEGPGIRIESIPDGAPGSFAASKLEVGEVVLKINGKDAKLDESLYRDILNEQAGRELNLLVKGKDGKERTVKYRAMSGGAWNGLINRNRIEGRRRYVEEKSGGRLTYVQIPGMGGGDFERFMEEFWGFVAGKDGAIIDVRNNGGGNISDRLIDIIERQPHSFYVPRDEAPILAPGQTWALPTVVMHAESSFSNAEMFPYAMKQRRLATLVGMPTPGYVIWTGGFRLVDGTSARMPGSGVYRMDGSPLENMGQQPDIRVEITPEDYFAGRDPQLDRAIEELMRKLPKR